MVPLIFLLISITALILCYLGTGQNRKILLCFSIWQCIIGGLALCEVFLKHPASFALAIAGTVALTVFALKRSATAQLNSNLLLAIHVLRIPLELVLYQLYLQGKIPISMTYKGINFDILMGISALILLLYRWFSKQKINPKLFFAWNITGIVFLLFIVALAILSSPLPIQQFAFDQPNIAVLIFPYCLLPGCVVPIVLMAHIALLKQQRKRD